MQPVHMLKQLPVQLLHTSVQPVRHPPTHGHHCGCTVPPPIALLSSFMLSPPCTKPSPAYYDTKRRLPTQSPTQFPLHPRHPLAHVPPQLPAHGQAGATSLKDDVALLPSFI